MTQEQPIFAEWRELFKFARKINQMAPWEWMEEMDIFGVKNPETGQLGFVSVMGLLEEHFAICIYQGKKALYDFWTFQESGTFGEPDRIMEIPQLQVSFENREELKSRDYRLIRDLNLSFKGRNQWPMFRSIRPGFLPWHVTGSEARFLAYALEQTLDVASRYRQDEYLFDFDEDDHYLVRVPEKVGNSLRWNDQVMHVPPPDPEPIPIAVDIDQMDFLGEMEKSEMVLEVDFFLFPIKIGKKGSRPAVPYMLLVVESKSGMVVGHETFLAEPSLEKMWGTVPGTLVDQFFRADLLPREIRVHSVLLYTLLKPVTDELKIHLVLSESLPSLEEAKEELFHFMR